LRTAAFEKKIIAVGKKRSCYFNAFLL